MIGHDEQLTEESRLRGMEAREGALDADLVELFVESGVYERVIETDWKELEKSDE